MRLSVRLVKRLMDIASASLGLVATAPLFGVIALCIKATSRGPVFYKQKRAGMIHGEDGLHFHDFMLYKFRTMVPDAEARTGVVLATEDDPRVTRIGRYLRRTRLDELPQLLNVLKGEMSLVGPRPERPERIRNLALIIPFFEERMRLIKPGITGMAQTELGYTGSMLANDKLMSHREELLNPYQLEGVEESEADHSRIKLIYDLSYSVHMESFWQFLLVDLMIIAKTPYVMFFKRSGQ